jgi:methionyl-tRNA formyltransferase
MSSRDIHNLIRAVSTPYPGAYTYLSGQLLRIWSAQLISDGRRYVGRVPGRIAEVLPGEGAVVITGDGTLLLTEAQMKDGQPVCAAEVLNKYSYTLG